MKNHTTRSCRSVMPKPKKVRKTKSPRRSGYDALGPSPSSRATGSVTTITRESLAAQLAYSTIDNFGAGYFSLASTVIDYASFAAVYDEYRIVKVQLRFMVDSGGGNAFSSATFFDLPPFYYGVDVNDAVTPTTINQILAYPQAKACDPRKEHTVRFNPKCATALYNGAFTGYGTLNAQWCNSSSTGIQHYGYKVAVSASGTVGMSTYPQMRVFQKVWVQFRSSR